MHAHYYNPQKHVALNEEEKKLKQKLLNDGFPQISYRDFGCFVRSIIKYGKNDIDSICNAMIKNGMNQIDENMEEQDIKEMIKKYHAAFFDEKNQNVEELEDAFIRIEEGEEKKLRLEREKEREQRIKEKEREKMIKKELWEKKKKEYAEKREIQEKEKLLRKEL